MFLELAAGAWIAGNYIYHRYFEDHPRPAPASEVKLPRTDEGAPVPIIYGRCRVRAPVLAWVGNIRAADATVGTTFPAGTFWYCADMMYVIGLIPATGTPAGKIRKVYVGEFALTEGVAVPGYNKQLADLSGNGAFEELAFLRVNYTDRANLYQGGDLEFLNGNASQTLVDAGGVATTKAGQRMLLVNTAAEIPAYRGYLSAFLTKFDWHGYPSGTAADVGWNIGSNPQVPAYSFEVESYPIHFGYAIANEANPVNVLYDLLTNTRGRLGLTTIGGGVDTTIIDPISFQAAAITLEGEGHGYSRAIENGDRAADIIGEILAQIDGVLYEDPTDGMIHLKLIRADVVPADVLVINASNCEEIRSAAFGGWTNLPNKVRVVFTDRSRDYADNSVAAQNMANAVGQDGQVREIVLHYPGVCTEALAQDIAARELSARSRPSFKCQAVVDRSFLRVNPGDVVALTWPEWGLSLLMMRVAGTTRGTLEDGRIVLNLIQDFYYVHRGLVVTTATLPGFPGTGAAV